MAAIGRALKMRTGEARLVVPMIALSFMVMAGYAIGQSGANALFLERIGADALPLMYLLQGGTAFALMLALAAILGRVDRRRAYLAMSAGLAVVVLAERVVLISGERWIYAVLWLTVAGALLVQTVFLWGIAGTVTDLRQAKRLFPLIAGGGILGSVVGGLLTDPLVRIVGAEDLLLIWAGALVATFALCRIVLSARDAAAPSRRHRSARPRPSVLRDLTEAFGYVRRSRLLVWMTLAAVLFSVLFFSLFLPWATAAATRYPNTDDLAGFLGLFWAATTGIAFLVSMLATNRLFGRFGIASMVLVLPLLYVVSFGILLVSSAFITLVILRFVSGVWLQGVASPGWETLTNVVPDTRRDQMRAFLNGGPSQAGTAIAGVIALIGQGALTATQLAAIGLITAATTVFVTWRMRGSYTSALVDALRAERPQVFPEFPVAGVPVTFDRDAHALRSVLVAAGDERPSVRRLAVQLLADVDDERARSSLEQALRDTDAGVRAEAVVALCTGREDPGVIEMLALLIDDADATVAASAAAAVVGRRDDPAAALRLEALVRDQDPAVRATTLERLRLAPREVAVSFASAALEDEAPAVRAAALLTLATLGPDLALDPAARLLEDPSPRVRDAAAEAIGMIGAPSVDRMLAALDRPHAREAALHALAGLDLTGREAIVRTFVAERAREASRDYELAAGVLRDGEVGALLKEALLDRARRNGRYALRALSLISRDGTEMRAAIDSLDVREGNQLANALETLEATAEVSIVRPLLLLWEPSDAARHDGVNDWLAPVLADSDTLIASCGEFVLVARRGGEDMARARAAMPLMERVLFLRRVSLFEALAPADLHAIAEVAEEEAFADGELLGVEGELGDELHIIVSGDVTVESAGSEIARRGAGDVVGEMSLITRSPRMASLVAVGDVRAIRIGRRAFESMVHDRPDIAIGVMRVLAQRLGEPRRADPIR